MTDDLLRRVIQFLTTERTVDGVRAALLVVLSLVLGRMLGRAVRRVVSASGQVQRALIAGRLITWGVFALGLAGALEELGFKLRVLLGAAGVLTVAAGFAAQTTLSNLISGFLLFGERPFDVGDYIEIEGAAGEVLSIDMMATSLRTLDNRYVRLPNELVLKARLVNHSRFPIRRLELTLPIARSEDFERVLDVVKELAERHPLVLREPHPSVFISSFTEASLQIQVWAWTRRETLHELRTGLTTELHRALLDLKVHPREPLRFG